MILTPDQYSSTGAYDLLVAASLGHAAIDHRFLHALLDAPEESLPGIVRFASEEREDARIDLEDELTLIARHLRAEELLPFLVDCVERYDDDVPDVLVETVCGFREAALEPLLRLFRKLGPGGGSEVPFLLASLGVKDERIGRVLDEVGQEDPEEASFCREIYQEISRAAGEVERFDIYPEYPETSAPPFEVLGPEERLPFLGVKSAEIRTAAAASYFSEPELTRESIEKLVQIAESDPEPVVRAAAWRSLAIEFEDEDLHRKMRARLLDKETPLFEAAGLVVALAPDAREQEVRDKVLEVFQTPETRSAAVEAMWRSGDTAYSTYIKRALDDADPDIREQGVMGAGYLGLVGELGRVKAMLDDPDLRPAALLAIALAQPSEVTPARMRSLFKKVEEFAGGLEPEEADIVHLALDQRLAAHGLEPMFGGEE